MGSWSLWVTYDPTSVDPDHGMWLGDRGRLVPCRESWPEIGVWGSHSKKLYICSVDTALSSESWSLWSRCLQNTFILGIFPGLGQGCRLPMCAHDLWTVWKTGKHSSFLITTNLRADWIIVNSGTQPKIHPSDDHGSYHGGSTLMATSNLHFLMAPPPNTGLQHMTLVQFNQQQEGQLRDIWIQEPGRSVKSSVWFKMVQISWIVHLFSGWIAAGCFRKPERTSVCWGEQCSWLCAVVSSSASSARVWWELPAHTSVCCALSWAVHWSGANFELIVAEDDLPAGLQTCTTMLGLCSAGD